MKQNSWVITKRKKQKKSNHLHCTKRKNRRETSRSPVIQTES